MLLNAKQQSSENIAKKGSRRERVRRGNAKVLHNLDLLGPIHELLDPDDKTSLASCNSHFLKRAIRTGQMSAIHPEQFFVDSVFNKVRLGRTDIDQSRIDTAMGTDF